MAHPSISSSVVQIARGGRALEERLLARLAQETAAARTDPRLLSRPILIVVPSAALRRHLQARIARALGPSVLGIQVQLVGHSAADILREAGMTPPAGGALFEVLARRVAAKEPALVTGLVGLEDGFGVAARSIRDLLSAGLTADHEAAAADLLEGSPRGRGLINAALGTRRALDRDGFGRRSDAMVAAAAVLEGGGTVLPARSVHIYGFADAPGATTRFLAALLTLKNAAVRLWIDRPSDVCDPGQDDVGTRFLDRFLGRLGVSDTPSPEDAPDPTPPSLPQLSGFSRRGGDREAREVAHRIRGLLDDGVAPEDIGVVARWLDPHVASLRKHLKALAIPFSGGAVPASWSPAQRRIDAVIRLLQRGRAALVEDWLEARRGRGRESDLRLAFRVLGKTQLGDAADIDLALWLEDADALPLPVRRGLARIGGDDGPEESAEDDGSADEDRPRETPERRVVNTRRKVPRATLESSIEEAGATVSVLEEWPERATLSAHAARARELGKTLRFEPDGKEFASAPDRALAARWKDALDALHELAPRFDVTAEEFRLLLRQLLDRPWESLGGQGGGVQLNDVPHARGLTFEHLFVLGLERDVFPRAITEDPMLPDRDRRALESLLPDLASAAISHDEERLLFASLLASTAHVTLSWCHAGTDGRELAPSPFVERLHRSKQLDRDAIHEARGASRDGTAREALLEEALRGRRTFLPAMVGAALAESRALLDGTAAALAALPPAPPDTLATARLTILDAIDPDRGTPEGRRRLGGTTPWFGVLGKARPSTNDPRLGVLAITRLENIARCAWRDFLGRDLNLERHPDPLAGPPEFSKLLIGNIVHHTLEKLLIDAGVPAERDIENVTQEPVLVTRPGSDAIERALDSVVHELARKEGYFLPGLHTTLSTLCRPYIEAAFEIDFASPREVLGVELKAIIDLDVDGLPAPLSFKADRVDRDPSGALLLTDYKTGQPISKSTGKSDTTRLKHLTKKIAQGILLQGGAYAQTESGAAGRYLFLKHDIPEVNRAVEIRHGDTDTALFRSTAAALLAARRDGIQFPRLGDGKGKKGDSCKWCEHLEACVQNDSGLKLRLETLADRVRNSAGNESDAPPFERHLARLWQVEEGPTS